VTVYEIGPGRAGRAGLREASSLAAAPGDTVLIDPVVYEDGPLACKRGVVYKSADPDGNHRWRVEGCDGVAAAPHARVQDCILDGAGVARTGVASDSGAPPAPWFMLLDYEICRYRGPAIKQGHGQWLNWLARRDWRGTGDDWWALMNGHHHHNGLDGGNDTEQQGSDLHAHAVTWLDTGPDHAFYAKGRGTRLDRHCRFIRCDRAFSFRCGNQILHASFYYCADPITYFAYDMTKLGGPVQIGPGVELRGCSGDYLVYLAPDAVEGTSLVPAVDFVIDGLAIRESTAQVGIDFRDLTTKARRPVTLGQVLDDGDGPLLRPGFDPALVHRL
jgi:hypothetical protein